MSDTLMEHWRIRCQAKIGSTEETPFGPEPLVYKVGGKMFALLRMSQPLTMNLKCDPQEAMILRETFDAVQPGYHMNKKHWNTIDLEAGLDEALVQGWLDDSYDLIVKSLTRKQRDSLNKL